MSDLVHGGMFTVMVVRVDDPSDPNFESKLAEQVARSPAFFANAPVVLDIKQCSGLATADGFLKLRQMLKRQHLVAVGVQNANATQVRAAMNADLAAFPAVNARRGDSSESLSPPPPPPPSSRPIGAIAPSAAVRPKIVTLPVRSGTQIYARGGDLIVLNAVSAGAEVIADGHVHIYGPLRGRAIAGASGDADARIFADKLEAELLCVAGHYLVSEAIAPEFRGQAVQVALVDDRLEISPV
jgi:septum site-determining protein MinC